MKNVMVFPCGSEIGLEIRRSVKFSTYFHLIGASSVHDHGEYAYDDYIGDVPQIHDENFLPALKEIICERNIDAIYPAMDSVIAVLKKNEEYLGCKVITSCQETTAICLSKRKTYEKLKDIVRVPVVYTKENIREYPVFAKPTIGYGARGTKKIDSYVEVESFLREKDEEYLLLEYLSGQEYTIDCFTDRHGELHFASARCRNRIRNGISVNTSYEDDQKRFFAFASKINDAIAFRGAWFVQVKETSSGELCLLEIAARFGGSSGVARAIGVNFALLSIFDAFDYDVRILLNDCKVVMDRALNCRYRCDLVYDIVFIDYDDCIKLGDNKVNALLVSFLFQCRNSNIKVVLLSRHDGDLYESLKSLRLLDIFDEVIHITKDEKKSDYICGEKAIFIDDSYAERCDVKDNCGIPVFAPDDVDVLLKVNFT